MACSTSRTTPEVPPGAPPGTEPDRCHLECELFKKRLEEQQKALTNSFTQPSNGMAGSIRIDDALIEFGSTSMAVGFVEQCEHALFMDCSQEHLEELGREGDAATNFHPRFLPKLEPDKKTFKLITGNPTHLYGVDMWCGRPHSLSLSPASSAACVRVGMSGSG